MFIVFFCYCGGREDADEQATPTSDEKPKITKLKRAMYRGKSGPSCQYIRWSIWFIILLLLPPPPLSAFLFFAFIFVGFVDCEEGTSAPDAPSDAHNGNPGQTAIMTTCEILNEINMSGICRVNSTTVMFVGKLRY